MLSATWIKAPDFWLLPRLQPLNRVSHLAVHWGNLAEWWGGHVTSLTISFTTSFYNLYLLFYLRVKHALLNCLIAVLIAHFGYCDK